jgi:hypothetical protein
MIYRYCLLKQEGRPIPTNPVHLYRGLAVRSEKYSRQYAASLFVLGFFATSVHSLLDISTVLCLLNDCEGSLGSNICLKTR